MAPLLMSRRHLPEELLEIILRQPADIYRYRDVCRSWRSLVDKLLASSPPRLLFYKVKNYSSSRMDSIECIQLFNIFTGDSRICEIPRFKARDRPNRVHSWHGWLVINFTIVEPYHICKNHVDICLYNPFSRDRIRLPTVTHEGSQDIRNFVLSSESTNPRSIALAIVSGNDLEKLMSWKRGDEEWTTFDFDHKSMIIVDIIGYKGGFCAIDWPDLNLIQFEFTPIPRAQKNQTMHSAKKRKRNNWMPYQDPPDYLVESLSGYLWMVQKVLSSEFKVYKLDWERMKWDEITSLGDEAIFLARNESVCKRADHSTQFRHNCIYFTFTCEFYFDRRISEPPVEHFGVYDMGNKTIDRFPHFFPSQNARLRYGWSTMEL